jgi:hypothetical protein
MCGNSYMEEDTTRNQSKSEVKSVTSKREDKKSTGTVVDLINGGQKQRRKRQISTEVIVLDSDDDDEPDSQDAVTPRLSKKARRSSSSSSSETIEIDIDDCKPQAKRKSSEVCVIDVDRSVVTPASLQKKPSPSSSVLLNFVVSKNSGRVSLYSANTGQPLHFNFDIDQLLTAETADSLMNAQVKRSSSQARESGVLEKDVKFRDDSVQQGKFDPDSLGELFKLIIVSLPLLVFDSRS